MIRIPFLVLENLNFLKVRSFSHSSVLSMRRPPSEEYENNGFKTRKRTADPFDRRWNWNAKLAEPYNVRGGHKDWTQMTINHRGVQKPGYVDPVTKEFVFVKEMVPEIIVPDLLNFDLKPYVPYNVEDIENEPFDAKQLFEKTLQNNIVKDYNKKKIDI